MGFSMGGSSQKSQQQQTSSGTTANTYSPDQTTLQTTLAGGLGNLLSGVFSGSTSPDVTAMKTASADTINKNYSSLGDRINRFLAARGFGKSGTAGQNALQTELSRQGDLATNESNFAGLQLQQNAQSLLAALNFALTPMGTSTNSSQFGSGSSSGSNWGFDASASFAL